MATAGNSASPVTITDTDSPPTLPQGVTFNNGTFGGAPLAGSAGTYTVHASASDGVDLPALQTFTLTITPATVIYVSNTNFGQPSPPSLGDSVDGDEGTSGRQAAIFGGNALTSIAGAILNIAPAGTIVVNAGNYGLEQPVLSFGGTFQLSGNVTVTSIDSFPGTTIDLQGNTLTEGDSNGTDDTLAGTIIGTGGGLTKVGSDALTLTANDSYTGPTTVSAGTLLVNTSLASSIVNVGSGGTLRGTGTITGSVSLAAGGVLAPGQNSTINTLNTGNLSFATGSTLTARINGSNPGSGYDQVDVTGTVNLDALSNGGATLNVALGTFTPTLNSVYVLISNDGTDPVTGLFQTPGGVTLHNGDLFTVGTTNFRIFYTGGDGNDVVLVEASPPSTVYVSNTNFGLSAAPTPGEIIDGDQGTGGPQTAIYGVSALPSLSSAVATIASGGQIILNAGTYAESPTPTLTNAAMLQLTGNVMVNSLDSAIGTTINLQGNQLTIGVSNTGSDTLAGVIVGSGGLTKTGTDTVTLGGNDIYSGPTAISAGSLVVSGSLSGSALSVSGGSLIVNGSLSTSSTVSLSGTGVLGGTGTVGNVTNSGIVNPGSTGSPGILDVAGNLTLEPGTLVLDLATAGSDSINFPTLGSTVDITGSTLSLNVGTITPGESFTILSLQSGGSVSGFFNGLSGDNSTMTVGSLTFTIHYNVTGSDGTDDVTLTASGVVPTLVNGSPTLNGNGGGWVNVTTAGVTTNTFVPGYIENPSASKQHSMVESVVYSFAQGVSLSTANFSLTGFNGTTTAPNVVLTPNGTNTVWTVTFSGTGVNTVTHSIGDGEYQLILHSLPGLTDNTYDFYRLLGDIDGSGGVDSGDLLTLNGTFLRSPTDPGYLGAMDFDGSNTVDSADLLQFDSNFLHTVPKMSNGLLPN